MDDRLLVVKFGEAKLHVWIFGCAQGSAPRNLHCSKVRSSSFPAKALGRGPSITPSPVHRLPPVGHLPWPLGCSPGPVPPQHCGKVAVTHSEDAGPVRPRPALWFVLDPPMSSAHPSAPTACVCCRHCYRGFCLLGFGLSPARTLAPGRRCCQSGVVVGVSERMNEGVRPRAAEAHCLIQGRHSVFRLALAAAGGPWPVTAQGRWPALAESQHARSAVRTVWSLSRGQIRYRVVQISAGTLAVPTALSLSPRSLRGHTHAVPHTHTQFHTHTHSPPHTQSLTHTQPPHTHSPPHTVPPHAVLHTHTRCTTHTHSLPPQIQCTTQTHNTQIPTQHMLHTSTHVPTHTHTPPNPPHSHTHHPTCTPSPSKGPRDPFSERLSLGLLSGQQPAPSVPGLKHHYLSHQMQFKLLLMVWTEAGGQIHAPPHPPQGLLCV